MSTIPEIVLRKRRALPFFSRHPWVFAGTIAHTPDGLSAGDEVRLVSHEGVPIARGLYNPSSQIRVRLYCWDVDRPLDAAFFHEQIDRALALRERLYGGRVEHRACRLIFSEGDGLSGLTVDRYGDWLSVVLTSRALWERRQILLDHLQERLQPRGIWLRTEKGIGESEGLATADGLLSGEPPERPLFIEESGRRFGVDLQQGQKTGFYFDQRDNRTAAARYSEGLKVLDAFCYTGGFSMAVLTQGKAASVTAVDSSEPALILARQNAELNDVAARFSTVERDVKAFLTEAADRGDRYGMVILDPPKMARTRGGIGRALKGYLKLNELALSVLEPGGILVSCSCSGLVSTEEFIDVLARAAIAAGRPLQQLELRGQAADHPVSLHCRETAYLKCVIARAE